MPHLCSEWFANQIFWLAVALVAVFFVLSRISLPRIANVLAERAGVIINDLSAAEDFKRKAEAVEASHAETLDQARAQAQAIIAEARATIQADAARALEKATADIAAKTAESERIVTQMRSETLANVRQVAHDVTADIVRAMGGPDHRETIERAIEAQIQSRSTKRPEGRFVQ